ncbi:hypothetical protein BCR44DRAFT_1061488 [Catenaria anguillulae PL171]|uniref:Uncharacterized protein n=1 Tax=Catenaria anguillulae PL171 TaxID=765915 RepID=A0A1Y2HSG9_9FUNG|nr:hypothetical protein BCR44DRAFT_1061488 [Catenaria anguillulae PL171]
MLHRFFVASRAALNPKLRPRLVSLLRDDWPLCRQLLDTLAPTAYHAFASLTTVATLNHESEAIVCALVEAWQVICTDLRGFEGQLQQWATTTVDEETRCVRISCDEKKGQRVSAVQRCLMSL